MYTIRARRKEHLTVPEDLYYRWLQVGARNNISLQFNCQQSRWLAGLTVYGSRTRPTFIHPATIFNRIQKLHPAAKQEVRVRTQSPRRLAGLVLGKTPVSTHPRPRHHILSPPVPQSTASQARLDALHSKWPR